MCNTGGKSATNAARDARVAEDERAQQVRDATGRVNERFTGFNDGFFDARAADYSGYAMPQVDQQYGKARDSLMHALADASLTRSSVAGTKLGDLEQEYALRKQEVADQARGYASQARSDVEQARSALISQATATGDAQLASNSAMNEANRIATSTPAFSPIGALFQNVASGVGVTRAAAQSEAVRRAAATPVYQPSAASSRVVN